LSIFGLISGGLRDATHRLVAALLPQQCFLCGQASGDAPLCEPCRQALPALPESACPRCALPTPNGSVCGRCLAQEPHFDATLACYRYDFPIDKLVQALKYSHRLAIANFFAAALASHQRIAAGPRADAIVPLPLSRQRLRERGFNQAAEIARPLARQLNLQVLLDACHRPIDTPPQASLPWQARRKNIHGAFECTVDFSGKSLIVIDDVMTTGATLDEFARTLKKHGAARVTNWVVARTLKD
jgi:ComF family protein